MFIWTIGDAFTVLLLAFFALAWLVLVLPTMIRQWRCKHDAGVRETIACDAICLKCGTNLGFIGTWRDKAATDDNAKEKR